MSKPECVEVILYLAETDVMAKQQGQVKDSVRVDEHGWAWCEANYSHYDGIR